MVFPFDNTSDESESGIPAPCLSFCVRWTVALPLPAAAGTIITTATGLRTSRPPLPAWTWLPVPSAARTAPSSPPARLDAPPAGANAHSCDGPSVRTSFSPMMRSYIESTSVMAVSKCVVASNDSLMKTLSVVPVSLGTWRSYMS